MKSFFYLTIILISLVSLHCSSNAINDSDPVVLFAEAKEDIESAHYITALEKLRAIKNKFPHSKFAVDAQLAIADVYFLEESFPEAAIAYETFKDLYPKNEKTAYAMFRIGKSYFNDAPRRVSLDLTSAHKALKAYQNFLDRFSLASETPEVKKDIFKIKQLLAEKELYIADFYFKKDIYDSAKNRYNQIIELYPETTCAETAKEKLKIISDKR